VLVFPAVSGSTLSVAAPLVPDLGMAGQDPTTHGWSSGPRLLPESSVQEGCGDLIFCRSGMELKVDSAVGGAFRT
jgi:hypothetical protein